MCWKSHTAFTVSYMNLKCTEQFGKYIRRQKQRETGTHKNLLVCILQQLYFAKGYKLTSQRIFKKKKKEEKGEKKKKTDEKRKNSYTGHRLLNTHIHQNQKQETKRNQTKPPCHRVSLQSAVPACSTTDREGGCTQNPGESGWLLGS